MDSQKKPAHLERNPKTHALHRREVFWQITIPLVIGILIILAAVGAIIFFTVQPVTDVGRWADVSLMWVILPSLFIALLFLAGLAGLIYAVSFMLRWIPHYTLIIQLYLERATNKISQMLNLSAEPILRINSLWAATRFATERGRKPTHE
jgi:small-conductance mechanosensitive channel